MSHATFVIPSIDRIGGAERQMLALASGLRRRRWEVTVIALAGTGGDAALALRYEGIGYLTLEMRKGLADPQGWIRLLAWLRRRRPDVLHAHLPHAAWMARASGLLVSGLALVDTLHSSSTGGWRRRFFYRLSRSMPDAVIAVSHAVAETHRKAGIVAPERLLVIPNGVDVEAWRPDAAVRERTRRELGFGSEFVWLAAGRVEPVKDYATMLRAFSRTARTARLVIAGRGPQLEELKILAERIGVAQRVRFAGFQPDIVRWMQAADGFVLTSRWEGLPMAALEAGACELPCVATRVPGTSEAIEDGVTGLLAEPGNYLAVGETMNRLMAMLREERSAMGLRARQRITELFSLEAALDRHEALYRELVDAKRQTAAESRGLVDDARLPNRAR
jgi:glycosyltransferase involved in cell wall biosynthesis